MFDNDFEKDPGLRKNKKPRESSQSNDPFGFVSAMKDIPFAGYGGGGAVNTAKLNAQNSLINNLGSSVTDLGTALKDINDIIKVFNDTIQGMASGADATINHQLNYAKTYFENATKNISACIQLAHQLNVLEEDNNHGQYGNYY